MKSRWARSFVFWTARWHRSPASVNRHTKNVAIVPMPRTAAMRLVPSKPSCSMCEMRSPTFSTTTRSATLHNRPKERRDMPRTHCTSRSVTGLFVILATLFAGVSEGLAAERELMLAVYSVPKEAYEQKLIPAFKQQWKQRTGQDLRVRSSYGASGAQA